MEALTRSAADFHDQAVSARKENWIGCLIYGGFGSIVFGFMVLWLFTLGGALRFLNSKGSDGLMYTLKGLGFVPIVAGVAMVVTGLVQGFRASRAAQVGTGKAVYRDPGVRVIARFGLDDEGRTIFEGWQIEQQDKPKYLVKLEHSDGRIAEYYTRPEVWMRCGEGMRGEALFDGGWLGGFVPRIGP